MHVFRKKRLGYSVCWIFVALHSVVTFSAFNILFGILFGLLRMAVLTWQGAHFVIFKFQTKCQ